MGKGAPGTRSTAQSYERYGGSDKARYLLKTFPFHDNQGARWRGQGAQVWVNLILRGETSPSLMLGGRGTE